MRSFGRVAVAAASSCLLAAGAFTAAMLVAVPANAGGVGSCTGSGTPVSCTITGLVVTSPQSIELDAESNPDGQSVQVSWTTDCTLSGTEQSESGGDQGTTPDWETLILAYADPDSCTVTASAELTNTSSSTSSTAAPTLTLNIDANPQPGSSASPTPSASSSSPTKASYHVSRGFDGKCIDDAGNSKSLRAKIQIWSCDTFDPAQGLTYSSSELHHNNLCLNAKGNGKSGSKVILWTCNGSGNEIWTHKSNGELVEKANGSKYCLDDPGYSTKNGTQLFVYTCNNGPNQHWTLP
jgi:Ricin-type beta-trefoil lectin domain